MQSQILFILLSKLKTVFPPNSQWTYRSSSLLCIPVTLYQMVHHTNSALPGFYPPHHSQNTLTYNHFLCPWSETLTNTQRLWTDLLSLLSSLSPSRSLLQPLWPLSFPSKSCVPWPASQNYCTFSHLKPRCPPAIFFLVNSNESFTSQPTYHNSWYTRNNTYIWIDYLIHYSSQDFDHLLPTLLK